MPPVKSCPFPASKCRCRPLRACKRSRRRRWRRPLRAYCLPPSAPPRCCPGNRAAPVLRLVGPDIGPVVLPVLRNGGLQGDALTAGVVKLGTQGQRERPGADGGIGRAIAPVVDVQLAPRDRGATRVGVRTRKGPCRCRPWSNWPGPSIAPPLLAMVQSFVLRIVMALGLTAVTVLTVMGKGPLAVSSNSTALGSV
jgi:hypothetical protein